jgi:hypothetical protein
MMVSSMSRDIAAEIENLLERVPSLRVTKSWFLAIPNQTAVVLLADILSSYVDACGGAGQGPGLMDGDELILEYKPLAKRLGLSDRSISRGVDCLVRLKALRRTLRGRVVNGKRTHNVVGVVPNLAVVAKFSGIARADILSAQGTTAATPRRGGRPHLAPVSLAGADVALTAVQDSLARVYASDFEEIVEARYKTTPEQQQADLNALAGLTPDPGRGGGRRFSAWARQYLQALREKAELDHGDVQQAAFDRDGHVTGRFTIEAFAEWVKSDEPLPNGFARRTFARSRK